MPFTHGILNISCHTGVVAPVHVCCQLDNSFCVFNATVQLHTNW
jgi:hypothetical protein